MMRLGTGEISFRSNIVGLFWVGGVSGAKGVMPLLRIEVGCQLRDLPQGPYRLEPIADYSLVDLRFALRMVSEAGPLVGHPEVAGRSLDLRSADYGPETNFSLELPTSLHALEALEAIRAGNPLQLVLEVSGRLDFGGRSGPAVVTPVRFVVPFDSWGSALTQMAFDTVDVVEVRFPAALPEYLGEARSHLRRARQRLNQGEYKGAVGECRKVLEAAVPPGAGTVPEKFGAMIGAVVDGKVAKELERIHSALRQITAIDHHHYGEDARVDRAQAQFILRTVEGLLALLARGPAPDPDG